MGAGFHYDPYMPEILSDPLPVYARMRREAPLYYVERFDGWAFSRFEDIWQASQDTEHYSVANSTADLSFLKREPAMMESLPSLDPPAHTELRKRLFPRFGPQAARALEPEMRAVARDCLSRARASGRIDAVRELAQQVAVRVACRVAGFPIADADYLVDLVVRFFAREPGVEGMPPAALRARDEVWTYLDRIARERASRAGDGPRADALDELLAWIGRDPNVALRVAQHLTILLIGATETFPKVFASGLLRLWQHPDQRRALARDPALIPTALTEILRYDMPTQWLGRTVVRDHAVDGVKLRAGQVVLFLYPSANRDEREFEDPDRFDIHRNAPRILTFGHGVHRCLGAFMARMEGRVLLEELLRIAPDFEVIESECVRPPTDFVQGYSHFPIELGPSA
jgi:cytochrome P450